MHRVRNALKMIRKAACSKLEGLAFHVSAAFIRWPPTERSPDITGREKISDANRSRTQTKFVVPILALGAAVMATTALGAFAHDGLGIHRDTIRMDALASATIIGVALAGHALLRRNKCLSQPIAGA
jgi:hypothetical protein